MDDLKELFTDNIRKGMKVPKFPKKSFETNMNFKSEAINARLILIHFSHHCPMDDQACSKAYRGIKYSKASFL